MLGRGPCLQPHHPDQSTSTHQPEDYVDGHLGNLAAYIRQAEDRIGYSECHTHGHRPRRSRPWEPMKASLHTGPYRSSTESATPIKLRGMTPYPRQVMDSKSSNAATSVMEQGAGNKARCHHYSRCDCNPKVPKKAPGVVFGTPTGGRPAFSTTPLPSASPPLPETASSKAAAAEETPALVSTPRP
ncbi:hypothetical protein BHM03_00020571 [Ensete ventricosum]|nr:hypothetical protein BHM03_00020571 [Ensete ventricosum]